MGQPVEVVVSELHSASARLADAAQHLQDGLSSIDDETAQLLGSDWKGGAASAYSTAWGRWNEGAKKVVEGLQRMSELLDVAGREYGRTDLSAAEGLGATMQGAGRGGSGRGGADGGGAGGVGAGGVGAVQSGGAAPSPGLGAAGAASGGSDGLGQALSPTTRLPQAAAQSLGQAEQALGGVAQLATKMALDLNPQAGDAVQPPADFDAAVADDAHRLMDMSEDPADADDRHSDAPTEDDEATTPVDRPGG